jgi:hypothetical protein
MRGHHAELSSVDVKNCKSSTSARRANIGSADGGAFTVIRCTDDGMLSLKHIDDDCSSSDHIQRQVRHFLSLSR